MIFKKQFVYPTILSVLSVAMLFGYQNCSKSKKLQLTISNSSEYVATSSLRISDLEVFFKDLLDQERSERIAADEALDGRINSLNLDLQGYKTTNNAAIAELEAKSKKLEESMDKVNGDLIIRINQAEKNLKDFESKNDIRIINLEKSLKDLITKNTDTLRKEILSNTEKILASQVQNDEQKKQIAEQAAQLLKLIKSFDEYKVLVSVTYATKEELKNIKALYDALNKTVTNLDLKVTYNATQINEKLGALSVDLNTKIMNLEVRLNQQGKDILTIRNDLTQAINIYKVEVSNQSDLLIKMILESNNQLTSIIYQNNEALRKEVFIKIDQTSLSLSLYMKKAISDMADAIAALDKKITDQINLSESERNKLKSEMLNLRKEMAVAIADEQVARNKIADEVKALTKRVANLELDAKILRQMAETNATNINNLGANFAAEVKSTAERFQVLEKDLNTKINDLRNDFSEKLNDIAKKSEELVRDLGNEVKTQFVKVTIDIAILNTRITNVEATLRQLLEKYQIDKSKVVNFDTSFIIQKNSMQPHLINTINAISAIQFRFIQILAPDQNKKDFYDADLKGLMASCDGNKEASFANIMGMDSFQLLALEYVRLLGTGVRSGNAKSDEIFFSYGAMDEGSSLARTISLALTRHTALSGDANCLEKAQAWATKILLFDTRFAGFSTKLAEDANLERKVEVMYSSFSNVKSPAKSMQNLIEDALKGLPKKDEAYAVMSTQLALDLITDAWGSMLITERMKNFSDIEKLQTGQSALAEEMKTGFKDLRADLLAFKASTNTRLTELENQQGKLTLALKKALDIIITLSDRGGHTDLVQLSYAAGEVIDYVPQIIPNWRPNITLAQHFYSNTPSNKSDVCTGTTILPTAGAELFHKNGVMNPCWANFRGVPISNTLNSTKTIWIRVFGAANVLEFKVVQSKQLENQNMFAQYNYNRTFDFRNVSPTDAALKLHGVFSNGVFDVKTPDLFDYFVNNIRNYGGVTLSITSFRKDGSKTTTGNTLDYTMRIYSPLVLDFIKKGLPETLSKEESGVEFDHLGIGKSVTTGWISGTEAAFLVKGKASQFASGKISGADLFGEGTKLSNGKKAEHGFVALAQYDTNKDGVIDAKDAIYSQLSVWFDYNSNGEVDAGEMLALKDKGVDSINLSYSKLPISEAFSNGNDIRYKSAALSKDQKVKANIYDVFFSSEQVDYK